MIKILFTGGGTGGHIYPIIAVARAVRETAKKNNIPVELLFAGSLDFGIEELRAEGIKVYRIPTGKFRRYMSLKAPWDFIKAVAGFFYAFFIVWFLMPDVIFAKGGYGSFSVGLVGRIYFIPLMIHDSDIIPGRVSRLLGKFANRIAVSFHSSSDFFPSHKAAFIGNPIRESLFAAHSQKAQDLFHLKGDRPIILIIGGSQGSRRLNEAIAEILRELLKKYEVLHQCGITNEKSFVKELEEVYSISPSKEACYHIKGYFNEAEEIAALHAAALVISRAGSGSIFEIAAAGKPSILIPLPESAAHHQRENGFFYAEIGAAVVIEEVNLAPHIFLNEIEGIMNNKEKQVQMIKAAQDFAKPDAARKIAEGLLELAIS